MFEPRTLEKRREKRFEVGAEKKRRERGSR
jgi:hypothetical protein